MVGVFGSIGSINLLTEYLSYIVVVSINQKKLLIIPYKTFNRHDKMIMEKKSEINQQSWWLIHSFQYLRLPTSIYIKLSDTKKNGLQLKHILPANLPQRFSMGVQSLWSELVASELSNFFPSLEMCKGTLSLWKWLYYYLNIYNILVQFVIVEKDAWEKWQSVRSHHIYPVFCSDTWRRNCPSLTFSIIKSPFPSLITRFNCSVVTQTIRGHRFTRAEPYCNNQLFLSLVIKLFPG